MTNSFDGILAAIGVNVGGYSESVDPMVLALSIIGGGAAMGVFSGIVGVYLSERAERLRELKKMEHNLQASLKGSIYWNAARMTPLYIALWSGLGIILFPTLIALPYLATAMCGCIATALAFKASLAIALIVLGLLGAYLAKISGESIWNSVIRAISVGIGGIILVLVLKKLLGYLIIA
ncbi:MAG: hypothetical protein F7B95_02320 [Desulfurococcales archaeon]|nr:hypothetical protein [Desulfurococcales archaeon]